MKRWIPYLIVLWMGCLALGCHRTRSYPSPENLTEWLQEDPDSCLWYHTDMYRPLYHEGKFEEMEATYKRLLLAMPYHPKETPNIAYLTGWIISYYYNALMLQDKQEGISHLTDSLLRSPNPFYAETMRMELLVASAKFYRMENRIAEIDSIGQIISRLPSTDDPRRDSRAYYSMAMLLEYSNIDPGVPTRLMERALKACRQANGKVGNEGAIYTYMGYIYWKNGQFEKAALSLQEGLDWYIARPGLPGDGMMHTYNFMSQLYSTLELHDKALETNLYAIRYSKEMDNWMLDEMYRSRATWFSKAGQPDSALYWTRMALAATPPVSESFQIPILRIDRLKYLYAVHPDSIASQLDECRSIFKDTGAVSEIIPKSHLLAYYGMALLEHPGHEREGIAYMEQSYRRFLDGHFPEGILQSGERLIRAYLHTGMEERIKEVYPTYAAVRDSLLQRQSVNAAIGADIRYEADRKEQENRVLTAEISLKERTLAFSWILLGLMGVLMAGGGIFLRQRQRYLRRVSDARLSQISGLLRAQQELRLHNASLTKELDMTAHELNKVSSRLDAVSKKKVVSDIRVKISTEIFDCDREAEFRRNFTAVYPDYLTALHHVNPDVTRTDELIAMLILLELSSQEIALTLGISKNGVNKARSRMRQRLGMDSEMGLEEFLKTLSD